MKRARPPPVAPQQEDGRLLEGELPATPGPALTPTARAHACAYTHTHTHTVPVNFPLASTNHMVSEPRFRVGETWLCLWEV